MERGCDTRSGCVIDKVVVVDEAADAAAARPSGADAVGAQRAQMRLDPPAARLEMSDDVDTLKGAWWRSRTTASPS